MTLVGQLSHQGSLASKVKRYKANYKQNGIVYMNYDENLKPKIGRTQNEYRTLIQNSNPPPATDIIQVNVLCLFVNIEVCGKWWE